MLYLMIYDGGFMLDEYLKLKETYPKYIWKSGKRLNGREDKEFLENWIWE